MSSKAPPSARPSIARMTGYVPGEQPPPGARVIKLNTNENPFPPSPRVLDAIRGLDPERLRRYPNPSAEDFRAAAARRLGVSPDHIIAGNGSDELLSIVLRTFVAPGEVLAYPDPTYSLYPVLAALADVKVAAVPWAPGWDLPIATLLRTGARAIFFANPNAPTGTLVPPARVAELARAFDDVVLVDEAYVDFAPASCLEILRDFPNVIVARTLSKGYALAGLRFGYAVADPRVIAEMMKVKDSYNCDAISVAAAVAAIEDDAYARTTWEHVRLERERVSDELARRGWTVLPSHANFVLATCPDGAAGARYRALKARGILVRFFDAPGLRDKLRITIGTRADNDALLAAV
jgi:histidinol-phosphate aminotransferase